MQVGDPPDIHTYRECVFVNGIAEKEGGGEIEKERRERERRGRGREGGGRESARERARERSRERRTHTCIHMQTNTTRVIQV